MFDRNTSKIGILAALVVLVAGLGLGVAGVAAQDGSTTLVDEPIDPTNETQSVYLDATGVDDMNGSGPVDVTVTVEGLAENESAGNGTQLDTATLSVAEGTTESYDYAIADADRDYDSLHLSATVETADDADLVSADWGTLQQVSGGAGGGLGSSSTGLVALVVLALGAIVATRGDD